MNTKHRIAFDQGELRERFSYHPDGYLVDRETGCRAGAHRKDGYGYLQWNGKQVLLHRAIWAWHHGDVPRGLDHIDRDPSNNKVENLRPADQVLNMQNARNRRSKKDGLPKGVTPWHQRGYVYYRARITVQKREIMLGYFDTVEEAERAYLDARKRYFDG